MIWYDARIRDGQIWASSWAAGTKVLVARADPGLAVGPIWFVFDGHHLRSVAQALQKSTFATRKAHSDQDLCNARARPFLRRFERMRVPPPTGTRKRPEGA